MKYRMEKKFTLSEPMAGVEDEVEYEAEGGRWAEKVVRGSVWTEHSERGSNGRSHDHSNAENRLWL